jgi:hypothetical protein
MQHDEDIREAIRQNPLSVGGVAELRRSSFANCSYATVRRRVIEGGV